MVTIEVIPAAAADRTELTRIMAEVFIEEQTRYLPDPLDPAFVLSHSHELVERAWQDMALARVCADAAGMAYVEGSKVVAVNVLRAFQCRGVGRALMDWAESRIAAAGHASGSVDTQEANTSARAFYRSLGYTQVNAWSMTGFTKAPIPMVTLSRVLGPKGHRNPNAG